MDCDGIQHIEILQDKLNSIQIEGQELNENVDNDRDEKLFKTGS